eukprot:7054-Heterococcus_DN1.PRE.3
MRAYEVSAAHTPRTLTLYLFVMRVCRLLGAILLKQPTQRIPPRKSQFTIAVGTYFKMIRAVHAQHSSDCKVLAYT